MNLSLGHNGKRLFADTFYRKNGASANRITLVVVLVLACCSIANSQSVDLRSHASALYSYPADFQEKILVHTDQSFYVTGETLWYSVFLRDAQTGHLSMLSRVAYLELLDQSGKSAWQAMIRIDSGRGQGSWSIPNTLPTGGYILRSYTRWMRNQSVGQFFHLPLLIFNPQKKPEAAIRGVLQPGGTSLVQQEIGAAPAPSSLSVQTDQSRYRLRSPVTATIGVRDTVGLPVRSSFSVSVTRVPDTTDVPVHRAVQPDTVSQGPPMQRNQIPEISGPIATVLVQHKQSGKPVSGVWVSLSVPGRRFQTLISQSGADGRAAFPLGLQEGSGVLAFALLDRLQDSVLLTPESWFDERSGYRLWLPEIPAATLGKITAYMLTEAQITQAFLQTSRGPMLIQPAGDTTAFYGKPDAEYYLDEYVRFTTMEEVLREFVREVEVRKNKTDFRLRVLNAPMRNFFDDDPLVLLDGIPIRDMNVVLRMDPRKLQSISIVTRRFYLGGQGFPGIITLRTYQGDMGGIDLPQDILFTEFRGLLPPYAFHAPDHGQHPGSRLPDLRRTLWWSAIENNGAPGPSILRFHTGDIPGRYLVTVYACTADGNLLRQTTYIDVQ